MNKILNYLFAGAICFYLGRCSKKDSFLVDTKSPLLRIVYEDNSKYLNYEGDNFLIRDYGSVQFGSLDYRIHGLIEEDETELINSINEVRKKVHESKLVLITPGTD